MVILGIDPGIAIVGWGVVQSVSGKERPVAYGSIKTESSMKTEDRLMVIHEKLNAIIERYSPDAVSIEELFWNTNQKTGIIVAEARGVIVLTAKMHGIPLSEYTPLQVKQSVVGYGRADKKQVISMVTALLNLDEPPKPDDTADALALAICHAHTSSSPLSEYFNKPTSMKGKIR